MERGAIAAWPDPRRGAPELPFEVERTEISPENRHGKLVRKKQVELKKWDLVTNDLLLHLPSGIMARVVQRVDPWVCYVEAWSMPETPKDWDAWVNTMGRGTWVCWGQCATHPNQVPHWWAPPHIAEGAEIPEAMGDMYGTPGHSPQTEKSLAERGLRHLRDAPRRIVPAMAIKWAAMKKRLAKLAGLSPEKMDEYADKHAVAEVKPEKDVEVKKFVLKSEDDDA
jgi:hypothetical protein